MHGVIDKAGLEFGLYSGSAHHANLSDASERKSTHTIWSDEGMSFKLHLIINCRFSCVFFSSQGQYSLARAQQSFKSLVQIHEKNGELLLLTHLLPPPSHMCCCFIRLVHTPKRGWIIASYLAPENFIPVQSYSSFKLLFNHFNNNFTATNTPHTYTHKRKVPAKSR